MWGLTTSQSVQSVAIFISIILYFAANTGSQQNAFIYIFAIALLLLVIDLLFLNQRTFDYEPHYQNWQKRRQTEA